MVITIKDIEKCYDRQILKKVSYKFETGKLYVIKGVSGCGKSTLLNIIGGVEQDFKGSIQCDDKVCTNEELRSFTGYVFQYSLLLSNITVLENLLLIKNDARMIEDLCKMTGVSELLQKYPEQISGGERQRVSIVRALLQNPKMLLMDEPTASLDENNSQNIAQIIDSLKAHDKIIIVATHEHYFDELADEIINLNYGEIDRSDRNKKKKKDGEKGNNEQNADRHKEDIDSKLNNDSIDRKGDIGLKFGAKEEIKSEHDLKHKNINVFQYNIKRNKKLLHFFNLLPFIVMFLLIMITSTLQNSFEEEYMNLVKKNYPVDVFNIWEDELKSFVYRDKVEIYDYYKAEEGDLKAYYLADKADSVLGIEGMIEYGSFPENENEVLITEELALDILKNVDLSKCVGKEINFKNEKLIISGIIFSLDENVVNQNANEKFFAYFNSDIYYQGIEGKILFIPYEKMKNVGILSDTEVKRGVYHNLYDNMNTVWLLREAMVSESINIFDDEIRDAQSMVDSISLIFLIVFGVCFIISCIFMSTQIQIELFYRKKELGFLQIFGLKKKRVLQIILSGYLIKVAVSFVDAVILYFGLILVYFEITKRLVFFNPLHIVIVLTAMMVFYFISVYFSTHKFLKKDIIRLISGNSKWY